MSSSDRLLVAAPRGLGRLIPMLPTFRALVEAGRELVVLAEDPEATCLEVAKIPAVTLDPDRPRAELLEELRATGCTEALLLDESTQTARAIAAAGITRRWGYRGGWRSLWLSPAVPRPRITPHVELEHKALLAAMSVPMDERPPHIELEADDHTRASERLARTPLAEDARLIGLYVGSAGGPDRRWPRPRFDALAQRLRRAQPSLGFIILATDDDLWHAVRIHEETGQIHPVIGPDLRLGFATFAALLARLELMISGESWLLRLAAAVGTRTLGLYARAPRLWAPRGAGHRSLGGGRGLLAKLGVDRVLEVAEEMLAEGAQGAGEDAEPAERPPSSGISSR